MAFSNMGGADCSSGANPMSQMLKQFNQDRSLQRDRFEPVAGPSGPQQGMRTQQGPTFQQNDSMVNEFFGQEQGAAGPSMARNPFQFSELQRELENVRQQPPMANGGEWASEFGHQAPRIWEINPEEEAAMEKAFEESRIAANHNTAAWREEFMNHPEVQHMNPHQVAAFEQAFQKHFDWASEFTVADGKGKGKMINLNNNAGWDEQFAAFDQPQQINHEQETDEEIAKKVEEAAAALDPNDMGQFEDLWENVRESMFNDSDNWEEDFKNFNHINGEAIYKPDLGEYVFEVVNPFLEHAEPMAEGLRLLEHGNSLSETALAFEAAVQKDPSNSEAWMHLGNIQAQNEKEEPAIRALEKAVETNPSNFPALMSLAISYTNESYDQAAYQTLKQWITERYPQIVGPDAQNAGPVNPFELHDHVTSLFLKAARQAPEQDLDPDVQVGLGVLFYGSGDLEKTIDCFIAALKGRPNDYLLWNRLGATLANSGRPEDAIDAYHKALELRPSFVRARYNLGVSCVNIGCYKEAAEHLLTGLTMHKRNDADEGVNVSSNLWEMLRKTFIMMDRRDLADKAIAGADLNQFRNEFEF